MKLAGWMMAVGLAAVPMAAYATDNATDNVVTVTMPDAFKTGQAPAGPAGFAAPAIQATAPSPSAPVSSLPLMPLSNGAMTTASPALETQQDAPLPRKYTVVSPIFLGNDHGTTSYIRFFNGTTNLAYTNVLVVGNHTGHVYGTASVSAPAYSSPQYQIQDILAAASVSSTFQTGDDGYSLYLEDPTNLGNNGFQHVIYSDSNGFFEDASMCTYLNNGGYEGINQILINVHTSVLNDYPAYVYIHNYSTQPVNYTATVTDARTGQVIGQVNLQSLAANTSYSVPFTFFQTALSWTPRADQQHANIIFNGSPVYYAIVGQLIYNTRFGSYVNMTHFCAINKYDPNNVN